MTNSFSRRDVLKSIAVGGVGSALGVIPIEAAEQAHRAVAAEKAKSARSTYAPKYFSPHQYKSLTTLCAMILPADADCGGAIEAGAPEFIDLLTSENTDYQLRLGGGLLWLDSTCTDRYGKVFLDCATDQQKEMLDAIAYRKNADADASLAQGVEFFSFLRNFTADGFFTSEIGIKYLGFIGNTFVVKWKGCPSVEGV
jgi:gluconate 2-dehydrogenase gamma chain